MKFPNAYKGITKILTSEIMEVVISAMMIVFLCIQFTLYPDTSDYGALPGLPAFMIVIGVMGVISLAVYLVGVVQAKKEEHEFRLALIMSIIALALQIASGAVGFVSHNIGEWIEFGFEIIELIAFESVVTGVINIAKRIGDGKKDACESN